MKNLKMILASSLIAFGTIAHAEEYTSTYNTNNNQPRTTVWQSRNKQVSISVNLPSNGPRYNVSQNNGYYSSNQAEGYYSSNQRNRALYWVPANDGFIPKHAVSGGFENGAPLFICQAAYNGGVHPGKIVGSNCNFSYGGQEVLSTDYQVLATHGGVRWINAANGYIPNNAVAGGNENGAPLYICQARYHGGVHPGKVVGNNCNFSYGGKEIARGAYKVLVS